jgi:hypothetical protein
MLVEARLYMGLLIHCPRSVLIESMSLLNFPNFASMTDAVVVQLNDFEQTR